MIKSMVKEIFIILLLIIIILLVLAMLFYKYIPSNKKIPTVVETYNLSEEIQDELNETILETKNIVKTYKVDSYDLYEYEKSNDYDKGKDNPFDAINLKENETPQNESSIQNSLFNSVK